MPQFWLALGKLVDKGWVADFVGEEICLWGHRGSSALTFNPLSAVTFSEELSKQARHRIIMAATNQLSYPRTRLKIIRALRLNLKKT